MSGMVPLKLSETLTEDALLLYSGATAEARVSEFQMILPFGKYQTQRYGVLNFTPEFGRRLIENWKNKVMNERQPFIDTDHNEGIANGWIQDLELRDSGLFARIRWTDVGVENVEKERFKYFSAYIDRHMNIVTGETFYPVLKMVSLTNTPCMENMPAVTLNDKNDGTQDARGASGDRGQSGAGNNPGGGKTMDFKELMKLVPELKLSATEKTELVTALKLTDTEKSELAKALGIEPPKAPAQGAAAPASGGADDKTLALTTKVEALELANKDLTDRVEILSKDVQTRNENDLIALALKEGRILPKDEKKYRELYRKSPEVVGPIIEGLPPAIDLAVHGSGSGGAEGEAEYKLTAEDREAMEAAGMDEDEYREAMGKKKPAAKKKDE